jgi:hypothetical protein
MSVKELGSVEIEVRRFAEREVQFVQRLWTQS